MQITHFSRAFPHKASSVVTGLLLALSLAANAAPDTSEMLSLRPPAVPLVASDPYLSIWSMADRLTDDTTRHWTDHPHPLVSLIRIDGKTFRLMGNDPRKLPAFPQTSVEVRPTRSVYEFEDTGVHVTLTFMTPALPDDLDTLARPVTYLTWQVRSIDGQPHDIALYDSTSALLAVNTPAQAVVATRKAMGTLTTLRVGTKDQTLLRPAGDDVRIDWGYAYAAAPTAQCRAVIGGSDSLLKGFVQAGTLPETDDTRFPRPASEDTPALAFVFPLGTVGAAPVERHLIIAYDELYSIEFSEKRLRPYWRRKGATPETLLPEAERDYPALKERCERFDTKLTTDLTKVGGVRYAQLCALAYRQSLAAMGIAADAKGLPLVFTKENTSNGDIATVDIIFPTSPLWLLLNPTLAKAAVVPVLTYAAAPRWKFPNAPHDLGLYPLARATGDAGEEMPVEESGNMLILCDAIAKVDGNADFVKPWWPQLTQWAKYLEQYGKDPENQLSTDDFMGHLAHNSNLSVKAILALAAYGDLCRRRGETANANRYQALAKEFAAHWMEAANDGDHYNLAFDKPGTWSQKYNLVWDKVLGLNVFPPSVAQKEIAFYISKLNPYGVPLDSRTRLGDTDHSFFTATLADTQADFEAITTPYYNYLDGTDGHLPMVDTYQTDTLHSDRGFHARSVVGGVFIKALTDPFVWKTWAAASSPSLRSGWAALPPPIKFTAIIPTSEAKPQMWRYTIEEPAADWTAPGFEASGWKEGPGGFGSPGTPAVAIGTPWTTPDIWLRRTVTLPRGVLKNPQFRVYHDEDVEIFVDGIPAAQEVWYDSGYLLSPVSAQARARLTPGATVTLAVHCHQTAGGQGVDVGLVDVKNVKK